MGAELAAFARDDALDYRVIEQSQDAFAFDVTGCRYAEFYKELGEPDLGFLLVCSADFDMAEGFGPDIKLAHTDHHARCKSLRLSVHAIRQHIG